MITSTRVNKLCKFKLMFHGIKCTEIEKKTTTIDQQSLNPTYKPTVF